jgi:hypothetical protein
MVRLFAYEKFSYMERGIIIPALKMQDTGNEQRERSLIFNKIEESDMKYFALYWNKILIPKSVAMQNIVPFQNDLLDANLLNTVMVDTFTSNRTDLTGNPIADAFFIEAENRLKDSKVDWCLHQLGSTFYFPPNLVTEQKIMRIQLTNSLPVPLSNTPIEDILEFKEKRADELTALHNSIDTIYLDILNSPDKDLSLKKSCFDLKESISNLEKTSKEKFESTVKYDLSAELNLNGTEVLKAIVAGGIIGNQCGNITIGGVIGGVASMLKFKAEVSKTYTPLIINNNLSYLAHASNNKIVE